MTQVRDTSDTEPTGLLQEGSAQLAPTEPRGGGDEHQTALKVIMHRHTMTLEVLMRC
jgi:hypothetical protein